MAKAILSVLGVILAIWVGFQLIGWVIGVVKMLALLAVIAFVVIFVVIIISRLSRN